jgi:ATP-dependent helicase/nuclease subunit A
MSSPVAAVIAQASAIQRRAADAQASIWVDASAGTGKTTVLTNRVLSLLLNGTPPARILCLTFTKAAAAEMANRIARQLQEWAAMPDSELHESLLALTNAPPSEDRRRTAHRLFARVLDTPGGMKIQTIHAFCQSLLKRFPLEAGIAPHFDVLDERSAAELLVEAREQVLGRARSGAQPALAEALAVVSGHVGEGEFDELMRALAAERARLAHLLARFGDVEALIRAVYARLEVGSGDTPERLRHAGCEDAKLDLLGLRLAATALSDSAAKTDRERGAGILRWLMAAAEVRAAKFDDYCKQFLTDRGMLRQRLITAGAAVANPGVDDILLREAMRVVDLRDDCNAAIIANASHALLHLAAVMQKSYEDNKKSRSLLDYEDLVLTARELLQRAGVAPWVLFKLDGGLDHILIDEAQDTNPEQWDIVATLAEEFFAGEGARAEVRTVFAVGDPKQSIFSFQRADPASFARMRDHFKRRVDDARALWNEIPLTISFRSTAAVLDAVNAIFARPEAQDGLFTAGGWPRHEPARVGQAGLVELWPPALPFDVAEPVPWALPTERRASDSPRGRLAALIACRIDGMIRSGERLESRGRTVEAGDVLVLVRRRDAFVEELVRELKQRNVAVAGVDRMVLTEQLAVMDLVAIGQFLLLPEDDLTLATVLKGPFVGFSEDDLHALAHPRAGGLWSELRERRDESPAFAHAHGVLSELLAQADYVPPYELYADLLGRRGGRRALLERLGPDAADPIDEFLNLTLAYERNHVPSLQGFLQWLGGGAVEIKRDLDQETGGQVRIMTVHGAKGLQAPIVFLPDTMQTPRHTARLLWIDDDRAGGTLPLWSPRTGFDDTRTGGAREDRQRLEAREQNRLLYVALTRAEDRLYLCGWHGRQNPPPDCWYHRIADGIAQLGEPFAFDCRAELGAQGWAGTGRRLGTPQTSAPRSDDRVRAAMQAVPTALPPWYRAPLRPEGPGTRPLTPSRPAGAEPTVRTPIGPDDRLRFRRGLVIHRLLELLPELPQARRAEACRRFLARPIHELDAAAQEEIARETLRVLADPVFAPLFGLGSQAEVRVAGELAGAHGTMVLSGQVDRLVITAAQVLVLDYKTNRPPPATESEVAEIYLRQMAAYRAVLGRIYADQSVTCALLWTDGPRLMPLSPWLLDRYLP